jgi:hypothetical protein
MGQKRRHAKDPTDDNTSARQRPDRRKRGPEFGSAAIATWWSVIECENEAPGWAWSSCTFLLHHAKDFSWSPSNAIRPHHDSFSDSAIAVTSDRTIGLANYKHTGV